MRKPLDDMSEDEARAWVHELRGRLQLKQARERNYLERRAKRGVRTPTDEAYEADQDLENDLLAILEHLERES